MPISSFFSQLYPRLCYRLAASWHHPRFGIRWHQGEIAQVYGKVNPRLIRALKEFKDLESVAQGWVMAVPTGQGSGLRWITSAHFDDTLTQRLRNLLQCSV